jgi:hypothetical protein
MTSWEHHHPPHDHPDFDAYLDTLTNDDLTAITAATHAATDTADAGNSSDTDPSNF